MDRVDIFLLERPHRSLLTLYVVRALLSGPLFVVLMPLLYFRYHTLHYRFDAQGIHMRWGLLFRREVNLTYARIQDIHVRSGFIQRWLGLADLLVQTASGSAGPEMTIEGFPQFAEIRDFLYSRMRGMREHSAPREPLAAGAPRARLARDAQMVEVLTGIRDELRRAREALQARGRDPEER